MKKISQITPAFSYKSNPAIPAFPDDKPVFFYDGVCLFCSRSVRFFLKIDQEKVFRFSPVQSDLGQAIYKHYGLEPVDFKTHLLLLDGKIYTKLDAAFEILKRCRAPWSLFSIFRILPQKLKDGLYDFVARNRYKIMGKSEFCLLPPQDFKDRFI